MEVIWLPKAQSHVDEIGLYIAKDSPPQADRVCGMIEHAPEVLHRHPEIGAVVSELHDLSIRELHVFKYRIIYQVLDEKTINILAVIHGARQLTKEMV